MDFWETFGSSIQHSLIVNEIDYKPEDEEAPSSPWSSPVTLHVKPGKVRFCLDDRKLNAVTVKDAYPIPIVESLLSRLPPVHCIS